VTIFCFFLDDLDARFLSFAGTSSIGVGTKTLGMGSLDGSKSGAFMLKGSDVVWGIGGGDGITGAA